MYLSTSTSTEDFPEMYLSTFQVLYKLYLSTDVLKYKVPCPALDKSGLKVSRAKTEYMCLNGTPVGRVKMQCSQLSQVTEFKYRGSTLQSDGDVSTEINKRTQCGWNNWGKMSGVVCDKRVPPVTSSNANKLEVTEMKICRWACGHTLSYLLKKTMTSGRD